MQDLDNHMDDLFRNAAENYRPNAGDDHWDFIQSEIAAKSIADMHRKGDKHPYSNRFFSVGALSLFVLLLGSFDLFMPFTAYHKYPNAFEVRENKASVQKDGLAGNAIKRADVLLFDFTRSINQGTPDKAATKDLYHTIDNVIDISDNGNENSIGFLPPPDESKTVDAMQLTLPYHSGHTEPIKEPENIPAHIITTVVNDSPAISPQINNSRFYAGLVAGIGFSGVKTIKINNTGYKAGIAAGYKISNRLTVESGLLFSRTNYSCNGRYFNDKKVTEMMPQGMKIMSLTGYCTAIEIPLRINYAVFSKNKFDMYASAGITSLVTTKESNLYHTLYNGVPADIKGSYSNTNFYPAASTDFRIGIETKLNNGALLRFEPYIQLPLQGIGIGEVKVRSAGITAGYILFK